VRALEAVNGEIFDVLSGLDAEDQAKIDETMITLDGTPNKARLAPTPSSGVSLAAAKAAAAQAGCALSLCRRGRRAHLAGAADEHRQWRRACRQSPSTSRNS
jgi:hypothetical protein